MRRIHMHAKLKSDPIKNGIAVLDFGGQYSHLICRRVRGMGIYAALFPYDTSVEQIRRMNVAGVILSGGPASVYDAHAPRPDAQIFDGTPPILGICYGYQLLVQSRGGEVSRAKRREYGRSAINIVNRSGIFSGIKEN